MTILWLCIFITLTTSYLVDALPRQQRVHGPQNYGINNPSAGYFGNHGPINNKAQQIFTDRKYLHTGNIVFDSFLDRPSSRPMLRPNRVNEPRPDVLRKTTMRTPRSTTRNSCQSNCLTTPEYNPVCGTDDIVYNNPGKLKCASRCGKSVELRHYGNCRSTREAVS